MRAGRLRGGERPPPPPRTLAAAALTTLSPASAAPARASLCSRSKNKGIAIELLHHLDDALWHIPRFD